MKRIKEGIGRKRDAAATWEPEKWIVRLKLKRGKNDFEEKGILTMNSFNQAVELQEDLKLFDMMSTVQLELSDVRALEDSIGPDEKTRVPREIVGFRHGMRTLDIDELLNTMKSTGLRKKVQISGQSLQLWCLRWNGV